MTRGARSTVELTSERGRDGRQIFQVARAERRRRSVGLGAVGLLFLWGLGQVWLEVEVAERRDRVNGLEAELAAVAVEQEVLESELRRAVTFGELATIGAARGLVADGAREEVLLPRAHVAEAPEVVHPLQAGLIGWVPLVGTEANAQDEPGRDVTHR